ncbi:hypothetical protein C7M51_04146 [Mixta intestinalis]|uniref:Uncharacterized protein n=1 Tax=Mixta intestinalis TaxID=1615494 RepID=A0A6P1Q744_9GAMM|nr:hypothetical protein C7M51_04146 [Mixta intestinalis]
MPVHHAIWRVEKLAMEVLKYGDWYRDNADDPDKSEYFVSVKWLETRSDQRSWVLWQPKYGLQAYNAEMATYGR